MSYPTDKRRQYLTDYSRKWRATHPKDAAAAQQRFYAKKAAEYGCSVEEAPAIYHREWYAKNREHAREYARDKAYGKRKVIKDAKAKLLQV